LEQEVILLRKLDVVASWLLDNRNRDILGLHFLVILDRQFRNSL
jgi:hypothetical protein